MADHDTTLSAETFAAIRASPNCLSWKRAGDMPKHLRIRQGMCATTTGSPSVELSYSAVFPPADTPLRGVVLFIHGVNEHSERYFHVFEALCEMGFGAIAYDLRSHGKSHQDAPGMVAHADHYREFIDDTNDFLDFAKCEIYPLMGVRPDEKLVIMAMSMGTLVSVLTVLSERHSFAGIVLAAPAVSVQMTTCLNIMAGAGCVLSTLLPRARLVPGVNRKWLCRESLWNSDYDADPLTTRKPITCRMGHDTRQHMVALQRDTRVEDPRSAFCATPVLLLMGTEDRVTSLPVAQGFYDRLANHDKHFELINGAYHVLFEDYERAHVMRTIQQWLHKRFPAPARGSTLQRTT